MPGWQTKRLGTEADATAPDGSAVRVLATARRGSMAHFALPPRQVSRAVAHRSIEEIWYFVAGSGRMWRRHGERAEVVQVSAGVSISIPTGVHFQFRSDSDEPLAAIGVSMPPWPGEGEAYEVQGPWPPTV